MRLFYSIVALTCLGCQSKVDVNVVKNSGPLVGSVGFAEVYKVEDGGVTCYLSYRHYDASHAISCVNLGKGVK